MNDIVSEVLYKIESGGYKAYIVGGFVRDLIWGYSNNDVDISTDAPVEFLLKIFSNNNPKMFKYDSIKFKIGKYRFDINHFRKEYYSDNNLHVSLTNKIYDDFLRRDFTFNAIYLDRSKKIYYFKNCYEDCLDKKIRFVGIPLIKINEDPSRLLRYIYFVLKYDLDYEVILFDKDVFRSYVFNENNKNLIIMYLNKIIKTSNVNRLKEILSSLNICDLFSELVNLYLTKSVDVI